MKPNLPRFIRVIVVCFPFAVTHFLLSYWSTMLMWVMVGNLAGLGDDGPLSLVQTIPLYVAGILLLPIGLLREQVFDAMPYWGVLALNSTIWWFVFVGLVSAAGWRRRTKVLTDRCS